jgi:hypothetical protein
LTNTAELNARSSSGFFVVRLPLPSTCHERETFDAPENLTKNGVTLLIEALVLGVRVVVVRNVLVTYVSFGTVITFEVSESGFPTCNALVVGHE